MKIHQKIDPIIRICTCGKPLYFYDFIRLEDINSEKEKDVAKLIKFWNNPYLPLSCIPCYTKKKNKVTILNELFRSSIGDQDLLNLRQLLILNLHDQTLLYAKDFEFNTVPDDITASYLIALNNFSKEVRNGEIYKINTTKGRITWSLFTSRKIAIVFLIKKSTASLMKKIGQFIKICDKTLSSEFETLITTHKTYDNDEKIGNLFSSVFGPKSTMFFYKNQSEKRQFKTHDKKGPIRESHHTSEQEVHEIYQNYNNTRTKYTSIHLRKDKLNIEY